jgi:hypothetical protein
LSIYALLKSGPKELVNTSEGVAFLFGDHSLRSTEQAVDASHNDTSSQPTPKIYFLSMAKIFWRMPVPLWLLNGFIV